MKCSWARAAGRLAIVVFVFGWPRSVGAAVPPEADSLPPPPRTAVTIGLLQGSSLIGLDYKRLLSDHVGAQVGWGLIGFDVGLTYHFKPAIRSRHVFLGYWNLGLGTRDDQLWVRILALTHVWRGRGRFTSQLGLGARLAISQRARHEVGDTPVVLLYSIGLCRNPR